MSNPDSFIDEVNEEVRRDRLFHFLRRWGWVPVLLVVLLVGGAAWNEYQKASAQAAAQARGDAILAALDEKDAAARRAALAQIEADGAAGAVVTLLAAGETGDNPEARAAAAEQLDAIAADGELAPVYRDLAAFKAVLLRDETLEPAERIARLEPLTIPGAPFRQLAQEQIAVAHVAAGDREAALEVLNALMAEDGVSPEQRRRVSQLIVALGGTLDAA